MACWAAYLFSGGLGLANHNYASGDVQGSAVVLNGEALDLGTYTADPEVPHDWIFGQPDQNGGVWHVTLILPHGADAPEETCFPQPITVTADSPVTLPPYE